uniref:Acetyl-coenzyme A carboxylase carboxyl transferase subunit beta, chloroplastic n=1 Tax=Orobanche pancicii TaxID=1115516 RepID=A0A1C8E0F4_9LAMI|nr:acetyl-CoA carboxylase beta subunit [Orobanche pancicii]ALJ02256.1 acetyl-CoA carboxylase beta subunit [Orobanche pancicii]
MERWCFNLMVFKNKKELKRRYGINKSTENLCPIEKNSESEDPNRKNRAKNIYSWVRTHSENRNLTISENSDDLDGESSALTLNENSDDPCATKNFKHLWVMCENCEKLNYKSLFLSRMNICEHCEYHLKMSSFERIEVLLDPDTWNPMYEDMTSLDPIEWDYEEDPNYEEDLIEWDYEENPNYEEDPIEWDYEENPNYEEDPIEWDYEEDPIEWDSEEIPNSEKDTIEWDYEKKLYSKEAPYLKEEPSLEEDLYKDRIDSEEEPYLEEYSYKDRIDSYQRETGLTEAVQTGIGQINAIPVAIGIMDFRFMGGSMGSVVGEKITRLIEYATNKFLPLIIVCASGGARMQEGSLSLMQMAKISSALYDYQSNKNLLYISILTSPTTGGVTASFGMLGDIIIAEPNAYIAFAGKRVIEQTLNIIVPEGSQEAEHLFEKGLLDLIVPRNLLKSVISELLKLHAFFPLSIK